MSFFPVTQRDIKELHTAITKVCKKVDEIHKVIYIDNDGIHGRLIKTESKADRAFSRTNAMWTVIAFTFLGIGSVLGYQMWRIDCLTTQIHNFFTKTAIFFSF